MPPMKPPKKSQKEEKKSPMKSPKKSQKEEKESPIKSPKKSQKGEILDLLVENPESSVCLRDSDSDDADLYVKKVVYTSRRRSDDEDDRPETESDSDGLYHPDSSSSGTESERAESPPRAPSESEGGSRKRARKTPCPPEEDGERWRNPEEEDEEPEARSFLPAKPPGPTIDTTVSWTPLSLFRLFFSASVTTTLINNTNANALRRLAAGMKFPWKPLDTKDFAIFLSIIIVSGLVTVPSRADYWRTRFPYGFAFPHSRMSRARFEAILWSLHLSNPEEDEDNERKKGTPDYDRLFKIKPLYTDIVAACKSHFQPYQNIAIDERMVKSRARISMKQYMKDKPTKWGYKLFVLADSSTAYTWNFFVYEGKSKSPSASMGLSYSAVMDLLVFPLLGSGYNLFVDNFYTSPALFSALSSFGCCGTVRKSRMNKGGYPTTESNSLPLKAERGDMRWIRKDNLLFVQWMDAREVNMCSTMHRAFSGQTISRRVKEAGVWHVKDVPVPDAILDYNRYMGGVDSSDQYIGNYAVLHKTMKWYKTFFYHFMDIAIVNSYLLHKELCRRKGQPHMAHKRFRETLAEELLDYAWAQAPPVVTALPPVTSLTCMPQYYGATGTSGRRRCKLCQDEGTEVKTPVFCRKCLVPLCLNANRNCFLEWHDAQ